MPYLHRCRDHDAARKKRAAHCFCFLLLLLMSGFFLIRTLSGVTSTSSSSMMYSKLHSSAVLTSAFNHVPARNARAELASADHDLYHSCKRTTRMCAQVPSTLLRVHTNA
jgi:hypothetical protein